MSASILSLSQPQPASSPVARPLADQLPCGKLVEIKSQPAGAQMTTAVACLCKAQARGETAAWVQPAFGPLFPPDLFESGVDLEALTVVNVPRSAGPYGSAKAVELLLRSGGFGMVVLDVSESQLRGDAAWQGRLHGLAREHNSWLLLLSDGASTASLGPLVSICVAPSRSRIGRGRFAVEAMVRKDKSGLLGPLSLEERRGPWGLL